MTDKRPVHRSDPAAPTAYQLDAEFDRLARRVYSGVQERAADYEAAFELACWLMEWGPAVAELAAVAANGTERERHAVAAIGTWAA